MHALGTLEWPDLELMLPNAQSNNVGVYQSRLVGSPSFRHAARM